MNVNNILLIIIGLTGLGFWMFLMSGISLGLIFHPRVEDPVRLKWLRIANFLYLPLVFSIAAIGFGIYNW